MNRFQSRFQLFLALALMSAPGAATQQVSVLDSYQRARRVVDASLLAMGGVEKVRGINSVLVRHEGRGFWRNQSPKAAGPVASTATQGLLVIDFQGGRLFWDNATAFPGGFDNRSQPTRLSAAGSRFPTPTSTTIVACSADSLIIS